MALVVLTFQDEEDGDVSMNVTFEPALPNNDEDITAAQHAAVVALFNAQKLFLEEDTAAKDDSL